MNFLIVAYNLKSAGGLRILNDLLMTMNKKNYFWLIAPPRYKRDSMENLTELERNFVFFNIFKVYLSLWDCVYSLGNYPLPFYRKKQVLLIQNMILVCNKYDDRWPFFSRMIIKCKRAFLLASIKSCGKNLEIVVQTNTMRNHTKVFVKGRNKITILPFIAKTPGGKSVVSEKKSYDYFYPASGAPHKNHRILLDAWKILGDTGLKPSLAITLDTKRFPSLLKQVQFLVDNENLKITNLGFITEKQVEETYALSRNVVFPSYMESFGLPLLDAETYGLKIVAAELDYVRDVCKPDETFNPESPYSLADAIMRNQGFDGAKSISTSDASEFWNTPFKYGK